MQIHESTLGVSITPDKNHLSMLEVYMLRKPELLKKVNIVMLLTQSIKSTEGKYCFDNKCVEFSGMIDYQNKLCVCVMFCTLCKDHTKSFSKI